MYIVSYLGYLRHSISYKSKDIVGENGKLKICRFARHRCVHVNELLISSLDFPLSLFSFLLVL